MKPINILVANPKGGSGKTTLATNLSSVLSHDGNQVVLWDLDPQKSASKWLALRGKGFPVIDGMGNSEDKSKSQSDNLKFVVMDSPAAMEGKTLKRALKLATKVIIPVQPSMFDLTAVDKFIKIMLSESKKRNDKNFFTLIGMRVDTRTRAATTLKLFLDQYPVSVTTYLKDTQIYPNAAFNGCGIFDLPYHLKEQEESKWRLPLEWIKKDI